VCHLIYWVHFISGSSPDKSVLNGSRKLRGGIFEQNDIDVLIILLPAKNFEACLYSALVDVCSGDK
jgi:hypothetical protein